MSDGPVRRVIDDDAWGDDELPPLEVSGGGWSLRLQDTSLDDVSYRGVVLLRGIRVVVRDHDWRTIPAIADAAEIARTHDGFVLTLRAHHDELGVQVTWEARIVASAGRLRVQLSGRATSAFQRNRIGLIVLHPPRVAGAPLTVRHPDGSVTASRFPDHIAPHQPAHDIAGLEWQFGGVDAALAFEGDVFEMEDQRNWTDASFKTYSTPLSLPFPVALEPGDAFAQAVTLHATGEPTLEADDPLQVTTPLLAPAVSVGASTAAAEACPPARPWLVGASLLVELDATAEVWPQAFARAGRESDGAPLDVRIVASDPAELEPVLMALRGVPIRRLAVFDALTHLTTAPLLDRLRALARAGDIDAEIVGGTRAHFTELNRGHESLPGSLEGITFSVTPQMHDTSRHQVLESLAMQRLVAQEAVRLASGRPVHVGPVTLRARFNAVATSERLPDFGDIEAEGYGPERVWNATDPRQAKAGYAAWLLASFQALAVPGVASIAYAETCGPRGFGAPDPYPSAEVLGWLTQLSGTELLPTPLSPELGLLAARRGNALTLLAANLTGEERRVSHDGIELLVGPWAVARRVREP